MSCLYQHGGEVVKAVIRKVLGVWMPSQEDIDAIIAEVASLSG